MSYPFWDTSLSYGLLMAGISILHVFVAHFAIGGGLYLVVSEARARKAGDQAWLAYLRRLTKFFVLTTLVLGAVTGVGIWFIIGLLNPTATALLIQNFVWLWAIEWTFFAVEIAAAILYYYGWQHMPAREHLILGWIYFGSAWLSLFAINGILTFMLTPGEWLQTGSSWHGFFNPTFWSVLFLRTGIAVMLAGLYGMLVASRLPADGLKLRLVRSSAAWGLAGLALMAGSFWWYLRDIPESILAVAREHLATPPASMHYFYVLTAVLAGTFVVTGFVLGKRLHVSVAVVLMTVGLGQFAAFEFFRESLRKPYVIYGYMYGNGLEVARIEEHQQEGLLAAMAFRTGDDGADLFRHACRTCHTLSGYKPLKPIFDGTDVDFIAAVVRGAAQLRGKMPPFVGSEEEVRSLAAHIHTQVDQRSLTEIHGLGGAALGEKVYAVRCGICHVHVQGGYNDVSATIADMSEDEYGELLDGAADYGDGMPEFTATDTERQALIQFWLRSKGGGS